MTEESAASHKKKNWFVRHKILTAIIILIVAAIAVSAASSSNNTPSVNTTASSSNQNNSKASQKTPSKQAHVGDEITVGGNKGLAVTLQQVIDPATGDNQYLTPSAGKRFVAVKLLIKNNGAASYQDDANNNVTITGSDNQSYTADFDSISGCTNFSNGEYTLAAGESATGCVNFQLPNGVTAAKVQFQTISGLSSSTAKWLVP